MPPRGRKKNAGLHGRLIHCKRLLFNAGTEKRSKL
jgi:hypothetical protein